MNKRGDGDQSWVQKSAFAQLQVNRFDAGGRGFCLPPTYQILQLWSCFVLQVGCTDSSHSLRYLHIGDNDAAIGGILIIPGPLWLR